MLLAADVGGTTTRVGLFERSGDRPRLIEVHTYDTTAFESFSDIARTFARQTDRSLDVAAAAVGVAGPVVGSRATLTNGAWGIDVDEMSALTGSPHVSVLNDLAAMAFSVSALTTDEIVVLQEGSPVADGNVAVIAAGTGLGESTLHRVGGRLVPMPSEAGHTDFAARTDQEVGLLLMLRGELGRVGVEQVLSGPGLVNIHRFTHRDRQCTALRSQGGLVTAAAVSHAGLSGACRDCLEALQMFVRIYGAETGNLALRAMATAAVYVGGGIAPRILPALQTGAFMEAFRDKGLMEGLLERVPVRVILHPYPGLLGAAVRAERMAAGI